MRMSVTIFFVPPMRRKHFSSITWSILACRPGCISPISSRKRVPPWATSTSPFLSFFASVKAPASWPKSSLSSRVAGIEAQLISTKGWWARRLL